MFFFHYEAQSSSEGFNNTRVVFAGVHCNIVIKRELSRSSSRVAMEAKK